MPNNNFLMRYVLWTTKMETFAPCMECTLDAAKNGTLGLLYFKTAPIPDDGVINITCEQGHQSIIIVQQQKFEILSEMGLKGIVNGNYRDSVASFAGALERLYEFFIQVACHKNRIDIKTFNAAWKHLSNFSERQLGAFVGIYLTEIGQAPNLLDQKLVKFRNSVIHKGVFPERDQAVKFGQAVLERALPIIKILKSQSYVEYTQEIIRISIINRSDFARRKGIKFSPICMATLLSLGRVEDLTSIEEAISKYVDIAAETQQINRQATTRYAAKVNVK